MKRFVAFIMALAMLLALCACGAKVPGEETAPTVAPTAEPTPEVIPEDIMNQPAAPGEGPLAEEMPAVGPEAEIEEEAGEIPVGDSLGIQLQNAFLDAAKADPSLGAMDMVTGLMGTPALSFGPVAVEVEPGLLTGFGNTEITGFEEAVMFAPMIGSIPFVGYVFRLAEDGDTHAFADLLDENADPRWNICTEAEQTVIAISGQLVFFVMCPMSLEA